MRYIKREPNPVFHTVDLLKADLPPTEGVEVASTFVFEDNSVRTIIDHKIPPQVALANQTYVSRSFTRMILDQYAVWKFGP